MCIASGISGDASDLSSADSSLSRQKERIMKDDFTRRAVVEAAQQPLISGSATEMKRYSGSIDEELPLPDPPPHDWHSPVFLAFVWPKISFLALCCCLGCMKYALRFPSLLGIPYDTPSKQRSVDRLYFVLGVCINGCTLYWLYWLYKVHLIYICM